ncbi:MAG TPA: hypothetical protein VG675_07050 [Bryobacteraceae bacterium]|nr:hypothetical protein [Bryobacteraceae bacterium]
MALSVSFRLHWEKSALRRFDMNWSDDIQARLQKRDEDNERKERLRLHRKEVMEQKAGILFRDLMQSAKTGINALRESRKDLSGLQFHEHNTYSFTAVNSVFPAVKVEVQFTGDSVLFTTSTARNLDSGWQPVKDQIDLFVDENDNLCLKHKEQFIATQDAALRLMLAPVAMA